MLTSPGAVTPLVSLSMKALTWLSGTAPMKPSAGWPLTKAITAGIDWMPIWPGIAGCWSMFILTSLTLPLAALTAFSSTGVSCLQGPHHSAQKSISTGWCFDSSMTSFTKVWVVVSLIRSAAAGPAAPLPWSMIVTGSPRLMSGIGGSLARRQFICFAVGPKLGRDGRISIHACRFAGSGAFLGHLAAFGSISGLRLQIYAAGSCCIPLPLLAYDSRCRRSHATDTGCGCSSVVEHDLAKVGVKGSSPFARSNFSQSIQPDRTGTWFSTPLAAVLGLQ